MQDLEKLRARQPAVNLSTSSGRALESMLCYVEALQQEQVVRGRLVWAQGAWYVYGDGIACKLLGASPEGNLETGRYYVDWVTGVAVGLSALPRMTIVAGPFDSQEEALHAGAKLCVTRRAAE